MPSPSSIVVRSVRWEDFHDLRETYWHLYEERDSGEPIGITLFGRRPSLADEVVWFEHMFRRVIDGDQIVVVAEIDGHVVGNCSIGRSGPTSEQAHVGELGILVNAAHRGKGVGSALLERALSDARSKFEVVYLSVFTVNQRARRLYEKFGFSGCGQLPKAVKRGSAYFDLDRMVLDFSSHASGPGAKR
jgi:RimJ/RimL family protein N-acetyltransferase